LVGEVPTETHKQDRPGKNSFFHGGLHRIRNEIGHGDQR
jgi:hypothetical protein